MKVDIWVPTLDTGHRLIARPSPARSQRSPMRLDPLHLEFHLS